MKQDLQIFNLIKKEEERQTSGIELIASENYVSQQVLTALGSICTNKYAEGYPGARYYGGCEVVDQIEQLAIDRLCELYEAEYANVQPHSGAQANMAVMMACLRPGETFMGLDLAHGGHLTHGSPVNKSGILYNAVAYGLSETTGMIDYEQMEQRALEFKPKLIIGGASAYSREWDYARMREIADKVGAILWRSHRCRPSQQPCEVCSYRDIDNSQDSSRTTRRYHHPRKGLRQPMGSHNS